MHCMVAAFTVMYGTAQRLDLSSRLATFYLDQRCGLYKLCLYHQTTRLVKLYRLSQFRRRSFCPSVHCCCSDVARVLGFSFRPDMATLVPILAVLPSCVFLSRLFVARRNTCDRHTIAVNCNINLILIRTAVHRFTLLPTQYSR